MIKRLLIRASVMGIIASLVSGTIAFSAYDGAMKNFGIVDSGMIYRSGQLSSSQLQTVIEQYAIRTVVNLDHDPGDRVDRVEQELCIANAVNYVSVLWPKHGRVDMDQLEWVDAIVGNPEHLPLLIHCRRGISRTGIAVATYRIRRCEWNSTITLNEMNQFREIPAGNRMANLVRQLERSHERTTAMVRLEKEATVRR